MNGSSNGPRPYRLSPAEPAEVLSHVDELHRIYRACFADPPWSEDEATLAAFPQRLAHQMAHPGAHGILAEDPDNVGRVAGAVYGWPAGDALPSGTEFDDALAAAAPPSSAALLTAPALVVAELMVHPVHRRRGLAREMLDRYLAGWSHAWLCTHPHAPAAALYESLGWRAQFGFTVGELPLVVYLWRAVTPATPTPLDTVA
jgi:GNAT superfamily N-acetyltransferase